MRRGADARLWVGVLLIVFGLAFLAAEFTPRNVAFDAYRLGWPLALIVPGVAMLAVGLAVRGVSGLCIPGAIVTVLGLLLAVQNTYDLFATWAYAWALVAPGGVGLGMWLQGVVAGSAALRLQGLRAMGTGLTIFLLLAAFLEGGLHISGRDFGLAGQLLLPAVLILFGVLLLVRRTIWTSGPR